jgi:D-glycerate 3-kinase
MMPRRVDPVHITLTTRIAECVEHAKLRGVSLIVGLCGPQGSGKSTVSPIWQRLLMERGLAVAMLSLDDFYLPHAQREALARSVHPLLRTRGVPGTHDVPLLRQVIEALRDGGCVAAPTFDKALDDRKPESEWPRNQAPVDVILFEGWCVGAAPQSEAALAPAINSLEREEDSQGIWRRYVNRRLGEDYRSLFSAIDLQILLEPPNFEIVYRWRREQEEALRRAVAARGGDVSRLMTDREFERFMKHFERLTQHILAEMPGRADLVIRLDAERTIAEIKAKLS